MQASVREKAEGRRWSVSTRTSVDFRRDLSINGMAVVHGCDMGSTSLGLAVIFCFEHEIGRAHV